MKNNFMKQIFYLLLCIPFIGFSQDSYIPEDGLNTTYYSNGSIRISSCLLALSKKANGKQFNSIAF